MIKHILSLTLSEILNEDYTTKVNRGKHVIIISCDGVADTKDDDSSIIVFYSLYDDTPILLIHIYYGDGPSGEPEHVDGFTDFSIIDDEGKVEETYIKNEAYSKITS